MMATRNFIRFGMPKRGWLYANRSTAAFSFLKIKTSQEDVDRYRRTLYPIRGKKSCIIFEQGDIRIFFRQNGGFPSKSGKTILTNGKNLIR